MELTKTLERLFPGLALRHTKKRIQLAAAKRVYDAAKGSNYHVQPTDARSADGRDGRGSGCARR